MTCNSVSRMLPGEPACNDGTLCNGDACLLLPFSVAALGRQAQNINPGMGPAALAIDGRFGLVPYSI